jgi:hypothetical protein
VAQHLPQFQQDQDQHLRQLLMLQLKKQFLVAHHLRQQDELLLLEFRH